MLLHSHWSPAQVDKCCLPTSGTHLIVLRPHLLVVLVGGGGDLDVGLPVVGVVLGTSRPPRPTPGQLLRLVWLVPSSTWHITLPRNDCMARILLMTIARSSPALSHLAMATEMATSTASASSVAAACWADALPLLAWLIPLVSSVGSAAALASSF